MKRIRVIVYDDDTYEELFMARTDDRQPDGRIVIEWSESSEVSFTIDATERELTTTHDEPPPGWANTTDSVIQIDERLRVWDDPTLCGCPLCRERTGRLTEYPVDRG